ncbi:MAG: hypothetical protein ACE5IC_01005 [Candidatus Brocadiales bacterium]
MPLHFPDELKQRVDARFNGMLDATGEEYILSPDDGGTEEGCYKRTALLMDNMGLLTAEVSMDPDKNTINYSVKYTGTKPTRLTTHLQQQGFTTHALPFRGLTASLEEFL